MAEEAFRLHLVDRFSVEGERGERKKSLESGMDGIESH